MLREIFSQVIPLIGLCSHQHHIAELVLLGLVTFVLGCCCGGILAGLFFSHRCRSLVTKLILRLVDLEEEADPAARGQLRLARYRGA